MKKEINFIIERGTDCSWCADLMKKMLMQNFAIKDIEIDVLNKKAHIILFKRIKSEKIIVFLKKRGYHLIKEK